MKSISIPLRIGPEGLSRIENTKEAIDSSLTMLIATPCYSCAADPEYGFLFNNLRFEIVNEREGVVFNSGNKGRFFLDRSVLYDKKLSGSSNNLNTFASDLRQSIEVYERRLGQVSVSMNYVRKDRKIYITVKGVILEDDTPYQYVSVINVWK